MKSLAFWFEAIVKLCGSCLPSADGGVGVLGDLLVGLLADTGGGTLDALGDVVESLLSGLHCIVVGGFGG